MKTHTGFTLIEVLIAMIVLSLGLLGLAALQATALKNNQSAYYRGQATQLLYDMADRMRANTTDDVRAIPSNSPYLNATPAAQATCATTAGCTPALMAQNDLFEWNRALSTTLPKGTGTIPAPVNGIFTITVQWDDNHDDLVDSNDPSFSMGFQL